MTFRTRLVLATTVAVVVAVLAASLGSFLVARHTLLDAADSSAKVRVAAPSPTIFSAGWFALGPCASSPSNQSSA